ncbi:zinc ABC transporter substrate-binding protein [Marimonas lutisalis]|uniref:zinc ABC transporter substrate-binding protein n=1 Tax=Marimonas lutisalis TaxID=2545756 RepID=UPI0010F655C6|nr:zinc ABC transporter substrate-binding protein [Marimonas lutisalis]
MLRLALILVILALPARADGLRIAVDLPAVHSLVTQVAGGKAEIGFVMRPGASPHGYAMRPSEARTLQNAQVVIWIGAAQSPWLEHGIETLAPGALSLPLLDTSGTMLHPRRERPVFAEDHDHGDEHAHEHDHDHGETDPHAWLDPLNARAWLAAIAETLSRTDPANAATYAANAAAAQARIDALHTRLSGVLAPAHGARFIVFHDAFQYLEIRYDLPSVAAISSSDASAPGPARLSDLRHALDHDGITCIFTEPQFNPALVTTLTDGTTIRTAVLDPLGRDIPPGPDFYDALMLQLAESMATCLTGSE